jgi:hypothetical protein
LITMIISDEIEFRTHARAIDLRTVLGFHALAQDLGIDAAEAEAHTISSWSDTGDDTPYADTLDRGDRILADRLGMSREDFTDWLYGYYEVNDCRRDLVLLGDLDRVAQTVNYAG